MILTPYFGWLSDRPTTMPTLLQGVCQFYKLLIIKDLEFSESPQWRILPGVDGRLYH